MTGCQVVAANVMVDNHVAFEPEAIYCQLRGQGQARIHFIPLSTGKNAVTPSRWAAFLIGVFDLWCQEDIGLISIQLFDETLQTWCDPGCCADSSRPRCRLCPGYRTCLSENEALCEGYLAFYRYSAPFFKVMRDLTRQQRSPAELMNLLRQSGLSR